MRVGGRGERMLGTMQSADELRAAMIDRIVTYTGRLGLEVPPEVLAALRKVPRHLFCEGAPLEEAYGDGVVITNRDERGVAVSSVSAAWLQALQLGQAGPKPGDHVLEIGSGGYNAALAREMVGAEGSVTSVDIDPAVTQRALRCLEAAGYTDIEVVCADAENVVSEKPFDQIIVTVGAWDVSPAWVSQLAEGGRLVVPLRTMSFTRSWELRRRGDALVSRSSVVCGFVQVRGEGASPGRSVQLREDPAVGLWCDEGQELDEQALAGALERPRSEVWTGIAVGPDEFGSDQDLWLATVLPNFCMLTADSQAIESGIVDVPKPYNIPAFADGGTFAYRPRYRTTDDGRHEFGAYAHGPDSARAAQFLAEQIQAWDRAGRPRPVLHVYPAGTPDADLTAGFVVDKRHTRLVLSWR